MAEGKEGGVKRGVDWLRCCFFFFLSLHFYHYLGWHRSADLGAEQLPTPDCPYRAVQPARQLGRRLRLHSAPPLEPALPILFLFYFSPKPPPPHRRPVGFRNLVVARLPLDSGPAPPTGPTSIRSCCPHWKWQRRRCVR